MKGSVRKDTQLAAGHMTFTEPALSLRDSHMEEDVTAGEESQRERRLNKGGAPRTSLGKD